MLLRKLGWRSTVLQIVCCLEVLFPSPLLQWDVCQEDSTSLRIQSGQFVIQTLGEVTWDRLLLAQVGGRPRGWTAADGS